MKNSKVLDWIDNYSTFWLTLIFAGLFTAIGVPETIYTLATHQFLSIPELTGNLEKVSFIIVTSPTFPALSIVDSHTFEFSHNNIIRSDLKQIFYTEDSLFDVDCKINFITFPCKLTSIEITVEEYQMMVNNSDSITDDGLELA